MTMAVAEQSLSSKNGIQSRPRPTPPNSANKNLQPQKRRMSRSNLAAETGTSTTKTTTTNNHTFAKITTIVFFIAVADVLFVWHSINTFIGGEGTEPHLVGAEAGLHHLHEKKRIRQLNEHVVGVHKKIAKQKIRLPQLNENVDVHHQKKSAKQMINLDRKEGNSIHQNEPKIDPKIAEILKSANVEVDYEIAKQLPTWEDAVSLYGEKPIIYGLETCEPYRQTVKPEDRMCGPAGTFNTGTNLLFELMKANCDIKEALHSKTHREPMRNGMRWHAPWGKHNPPATYRLQHVAKMWGEGINQTAFYPVTMIKDPYTWMGSQCRHKYTTNWHHGKGNCPNLIKKNIVDKDVPEKVVTIYPKGYVYYDSLIDMWNKYYEEWEEQTFPHLTTRFEDLLFHGEEVTRIVCDCIGGVMHNKFRYIGDSAKENGMPIHKGANGLVKALIQYGNPNKRLEGMTDRDQVYANKALNAELMKRYGYTYPPLPTRNKT